MDATKTAKPERYLPGAAGIRALACILVLVAHDIVIVYPTTAEALVGVGKIGVWLFFVLSAYLLTNNFLSYGFNVPTCVLYIHGRLWRILPLFIISVIFYRWAGTAGINSWDQAEQAISMTAGFAHLWTIPVEFKFYFALPVFVYALQVAYRRFHYKGAVGGALLFIVAHQLIFPFWKLPENIIETKWYLSSFVCGIAGALLPRVWSVRTTNTLGIAILGVVVFSMPFVRRFILGTESSGDLLNKYLFFSIIWTTFIVTQSAGRGLIGIFLSSWPMQRIGRWSYGIYLFHWFIAYKAAEIASRSFAGLTLACSIGLALLTGYLAYEVIERPCEWCRGLLSHKLKNILPRTPAE